MTAAGGGGVDAQWASLQVELSLARKPEAAFLARRAVAELCERAGLSGSRCHTLSLLVSELVTNSVLHSDAPASEPIRLLASADHQDVRVEVSDGGSGFTPDVRDPSQLGGGWGLYLVDKEALRWGVDNAAGTRVWFEMTIAV